MTDCTAILEYQQGCTVILQKVSATDSEAAAFSSWTMQEANLASVTA